jgi:hypothetical protein
MLFFEYFKISYMYLDNFFNPKGMKWGYVGYHFLYCYINCCIFCNKKAELSHGHTIVNLSFGSAQAIPQAIPHMVEAEGTRGH